MWDFDRKRHSKGVKLMLKERLSAAHCGSAGYGCARLKFVGAHATYLFVVAPRDIELDAHTGLALHVTVTINWQTAAM
jgi:hypothetical protein